MNIENFTNKVLCGDSFEVLKTLPDNSVDMVMTSPPYWGLRDYGVDRQLGLEQDYESYISRLCDIFDEVKRVIKDDGSVWVNIGDTYGTVSGGMEQLIKLKNETPTYGKIKYSEGYDGVTQKAKSNLDMHKCLVQIPARFSIEMVNRGWILRNTIIWHKPNCMPSSVTDRFTVDFEYLFFFVKNKKYYFEKQLEPNSPESEKDYKAREARGKLMWGDGSKSKHWGGKSGIDDYDKSDRNRSEFYNPDGRNKRCVWTITTKPLHEEHFAAYPEDLCTTPIKAGCPIGGIVLDPFCGSGTTCIQAKVLSRNFIGIELNPKYVKMAENRIYDNVGLL